MKRYLLQWTIPILGLFLLINTTQAQQQSRAEAIANIAVQYPHRDKSPEQIYDEGQIWQVANTFAKRFRNRDLGALTGPLEEDLYHEVTKHIPKPVRIADANSTHKDSTNQVQGKSQPRLGKSVVDTTSRVVSTSVDEFGQPIEIIKERVQRSSIFNTGHKIVTTAEQDYSEADRRAIRKTFLSMFETLPTDVRIVLEPEKIRYHGQTATVQARWEYDIAGHVTSLSRPYKNKLPKSITLQMRRVGDEWQVANFRDLVNQLKTDITSR